MGRPHQRWRNMANMGGSCVIGGLSALSVVNHHDYMLSLLLYSRSLRVRRRGEAAVQRLVMAVVAVIVLQV